MAPTREKARPARGDRMNRGVIAAAVLVLAQAACGGSRPAEPPKSGTVETRWLRGLSATEVRKAATARGLTCDEPKREGGTNMWACGGGTPLVSYRVRFYGSAPLKIEYVTATVAQAGTPRPDLAEPLFVDLSGLPYQGAEPVKAREWTRRAIPSGGDLTIGPAKFRVRGDARKLTLDIKASGSEW
jgi:hypothetical protein